MTDHELVQQSLRGNAVAQKQLYDRFAAAMLAVCYRYTKSMADAEDILQEAFIKVFRSLQQFRNDGPLGAWIRRIVVTTAINHIRKNQHYQSELVFEDLGLIAISTTAPDISLGARELADLIRQLPPGYQAIFNLYAVEGYNHKEIGQLLGINEGTSRSQYARARALLIQWIGKSSGQKQEVYVR